jgi:hypothetical protein
VNEKSMNGLKPIEEKKVREKLYENNLLQESEMAKNLDN